MKVNIITNKELLEGIIASLFFPTTLYYFKHLEPQYLFIMSMLAWMITWIMRKASNHIYDQLQNKFKWKNKVYFIHI